MTRTRAQLERLAAELRFQVDPLEKVLRLLELLEGLRSHPFLRERLALKGGTALNLFLGDLPRLSVDIDLNYIGAVERSTMLAERPLVDRAIEDVCRRFDLAVRRVPDDHAGGKWRLGYSRAGGGSATLELDLNFLARQPLFAPRRRDSIELGGAAARGILVMDEHELAAGKLAALVGRSASRDVFDAHRLLKRSDIDVDRLRLCFAVYVACGRDDPRALTIESVNMDPRDAEQRLLPLLHADLVTERRNVRAWSEMLVGELRGMLAPLIPFTGRVLAFFDVVQERGEIASELLTDDPAVQARIRTHPGLAWKCANVRRHRGLDGGANSADAPTQPGPA